MNQFIKEIQEQPEMLERTLGYYHSREGKERLDAVCTLWTTGDYDKNSTYRYGKFLFCITSCRDHDDRL